MPSFSSSELDLGIRKTLRQRCLVKPLNDKATASFRPAYQQGRLGQAITGIERFAPEAAFGEGRGEMVQSRGPHRFRTVERQGPTTEIEILLVRR